MIKRYTTAAALFVFIIYISLGIAPAAASKTRTVTITDEWNRKIEVPNPPQRIISINSYVSELLCAFNAEPRMVGRTDHCIYPESLQKIRSIGSSWQKPNLEAILQLKPDLVIVDSRSLSPDYLDKLTAFGITTIGFTGYDIDSILGIIDSLGKVLNQEERAKTLRTAIVKYRTSIEKKVAGLDKAKLPSLFFESVNGLYQTYGPGSSGHDRITSAGARNLAGSEPIRFPKLSAEWVLVKDPDIIVKEIAPLRVGEIVPSKNLLEDIRDSIIARAELKNTQAVKSGRVYTIWSRLFAGPRSVVGMAYLAKWSNPEAFADLNPAAIHREILRVFYNLKLEGVWAYPEPK